MQSVYSVRPFRLSDMDRVLQIEHASFRKDAYDRNLFAEFFHKCGGCFLVAEEGIGNICGYMVTCIGGNRPGIAELVSVAVDPDARGRGVATAMMDSTLRRLRRRGVERFTLMVKVTNRKARRFYERYGFEKVRLVRGYYREGSDAIRMVKSLR